jgi:tripartite-type tricarboxylate transporter receptor subunit TctC
VGDKLREHGFLPVGNTPAQFRAYLASEIKAYEKMTRVAGIQPE